ncbi:MAG TPA: hypothetical protein VHP37_17760 [Burkholderiales bacterium]|nr:hypothetical protein [Burkholderiales bacterium]
MIRAPAALFCLLVAGAAMAQTPYPVKPVRVLPPFASGSGLIAGEAAPQHAAMKRVGDSVGQALEHLARLNVRVIARSRARGDEAISGRSA